MSKRKLLFVLGSLGAGGAERQVLRILTHLNRERFAPALYVVNREGELLDQVPADVPIFAYWDDRVYPRLNFPGRILLSQARDLARVIERERIDLVYDRASQMTLTASLAMRRNSIPRVSVAVGDPSRDFELLHSRFAFAKRHLLRRAYQSADRVVGVSEGVRQGLIDFFGLPPAQVVTCPNLFDIDQIDEAANVVFDKYESDRFEIVSVGRLSPEKGHIHLLRAIERLVNIARLPHVRLWLVGNGPIEQELRDFVEAQGLGGHVRFAGYQANPLPFVKHARLFCLPSLYEGMPNALIEAMICGTPVISSDCPSGPREILGEASKFGCLVPAADANALADAMANAIAEYPELQAKTLAARQHIIDNYSLKPGLRRLESLFDTLIDASPRSTKVDT
ncbi:MAG TPA: glycosyltransferase [Pirellulaceae bacterium]|nr:glycosyltransferase [Pirellulaceae bacterium]